MCCFVVLHIDPPVSYVHFKERWERDKEHHKPVGHCRGCAGARNGAARCDDGRCKDEQMRSTAHFACGLLMRVEMHTYTTPHMHIICVHTYNIHN